MKFFFLCAFILNTYAYADTCVCGAKVENNEIIKTTAKNESECYQTYIAPFLNSKKMIEYCTKDNIELKWACSSNKNTVADTITTTINCRGANLIAGAEAINVVNVIPALNWRLRGNLQKEPCDNHKVTNLKTARTREFENNNKNETHLNAEKVSLDFKNLDELKAAFKDVIPGQILDRPIDKTQVAISLPNDNKGFGLFYKVFKVEDGDEFGYTHGLIINISKGLNNGYHATLEYSTKLYTQALPGPRIFNPSDGLYHTDQYFLEERLAKVVIDDKDKNNTHYFKAGVGWQELNNDNTGGVLGGAYQQQMIHTTLVHVDPSDANTYDNIGRGSVKQGAYGELAVGVRPKDNILSPRMRATAYAEAGISGTTADQRSLKAGVEVGANVDYQPEGSQYAVRVGVSSSASKYYDDSPVQILHNMTLEVGNKSYQCGATLTMKANADGPKYQEFNNDQDRIMDLHCKKNY